VSWKCIQHLLSNYKMLGQVTIICINIFTHRFFIYLYAVQAEVSDNSTTPIHSLTYFFS